MLFQIRLKQKQRINSIQFVFARFSLLPLFSLLRQAIGSVVPTYKWKRNHSGHPVNYRSNNISFENNSTPQRSGRFIHCRRSSFIFTRH